MPLGEKRVYQNVTKTPKFLRKLKARCLRFTPEEPSVLIFGLRRGGSSMIADTISANRGVWFADEPFAVFPQRAGYPRHMSELFAPLHSHFFALEGDEQARFAAFFDGLVNARFREMGTARRTLPGLKANRVTLKILNAPWMLSWVHDTTDAHIITLLRHPGAQARSVMRLGWRYPTEAYLKRPDVLDGVFTSEQIACAQAIFANDDVWSRAVLDWVVTSAPLRRAQGARIYKAHYEDIVTDPQSFITDVLIAKCGLSDHAAMEAAILRPSGSSRMNEATATQSIQARDTDKIINGWRHKTSAEEMRRGQEILDIFGVSEYQF